MAYDLDAHAGVIRGEDSQSYYFTLQQWVSDGAEPEENLPVTFNPEGLHRAAQIRCAPGRG